MNRLKYVVLFSFIFVGIFALSMRADASTRNVKISSVKMVKAGVKIKWKNSKKVKGYQIFRSVDGSKFKAYDYTKKKYYTDKYTDTGTKVKYKVRSYTKKNGKKKYQKKSRASEAFTALPHAPAYLTVNRSDQKNLLNWEDIDEASLYVIYRKVNDGPYEYLDLVKNDEYSYIDADVVPDSTYKYKVQTVEVVDGEVYTSVIAGEAVAVGKKGIDVSYHNGKINWKKVKKAGVSFAMIRLGHGKYGCTEDVMLARNYKEAKKAGIKVGFYFYSYAKTVKAAKKEAKFTAKLLKKYPAMDLPIAFDYEEPGRNRSKYKSANTKIIKAYCDYLEKRNYDTMVYSYLDFFKNATYYKKISKYGIWLANWTFTSKKFSNCGIPNVQMWQYSDRGKIKGISGRTDLNIMIRR